MKIADFERAIDALGVQGLKILEMKTPNGADVRECYAKMGGLVWLKWDESGRGFRFDQEEGIEGCISSDHAAYLDYRRDKDFDLKFE